MILREYGKKDIRDRLVFDPPDIGSVLQMGGRPQGGQGIFDNSPFGNNGAITQAVWKRLPSGLWYLDFDGLDDLVTVSANASLDLTTGMTLKIWARIASGITAIKALMTTLTATPYVGWQFLLSTTQFYLATIPDGVADSGAITVSDETWYHCVAVHTGSALFIYLNGVQKATDATAGTLTSYAANNLLIGDRSVSIGHAYWNGDLALPLMLNTGWSAPQVLNNYNQERHLFGV